ncbi:hypothetical protein ZWY2020_011568 [Hordeum vulgare]|nr:hypothetical protein ZWY2020_011568 [Hordeum vulgare]
MKPNARLQPKALQLIEDIRMAVHSACGPTVSCADITVHAARDAVVVVTGDSIFNLLALADIETDKDDRPVLWNPFDDIVPRQLTKIQPAPRADAERKPEKKVLKYVLCMLEPIVLGLSRQKGKNALQSKEKYA